MLADEVRGLNHTVPVLNYNELGTFMPPLMSRELEPIFWDWPFVSGSQLHMKMWEGFFGLSTILESF